MQQRINQQSNYDGSLENLFLVSQKMVFVLLVFFQSGRLHAESGTSLAKSPAASNVQVNSEKQLKVKITPVKTSKSPEVSTSNNSVKSTLSVEPVKVNPAQVEKFALDPQKVVELSLKQSYAVKNAELINQKNEAIAGQLLGAYDFLLSFNPSYTYSEAQNLAGTANPIDRTLTISTTVNKRYKSGTLFALNYDKVSQKSTLSSFSQSLRRETANSDVFGVTITQSMWANGFGEADRATYQQSRDLSEAAKLTKEEGLEDSVLGSLTAFWNAYVSEVQLRENTKARDKYEELVRAIRRRSGFNLSAPGELPRLEAEFEAADARVKISAQQYLAAVDNLKTNLRIEKPKAGTELEIEFLVKAETVEDLPTIPQLEPVNEESLKKLRPIAIASLNTDSADQGLKIAMTNASPTLNLVGSAKSTGVDEKPDGSVSQMLGGTKPTYMIGLQLSVPIDSEAFRAARGLAAAQARIAQNDARLTLDSLRDKIHDAERGVISTHESAVSNINIVGKRSRVVQELETSYRQGRTALVEVIRAYNDLFASQQDRARSIGNYQIALNTLAALRDQLVVAK